MPMVTQIEIDQSLLDEALQLNDRQSIDATVEAALREYVQRRQRMKILELFGTIDYDETHDYKAQRYLP
jgi:Arc/MetJ family transcription regulator